MSGFKEVENKEMKEKRVKSDVVWIKEMRVEISEKMVNDLIDVV